MGEWCRLNTHRCTREITRCGDPKEKDLPAFQRFRFLVEFVQERLRVRNQLHGAGLIPVSQPCVENRQKACLCGMSERWYVWGKHLQSISPTWVVGYGQ